MQLLECYNNHMLSPIAGIGPSTLGHVWLQGLRDVFQHQLPSPPAHRLIHLVRHKNSTKAACHVAMTIPVHPLVP